MSLAPRTFSSGLGLLAPLYMRHQSDLGVCRLETSWNRCLSPPPAGYPFMPQDWEHTPAAVQAYVHTLQDELTQLRTRVEALEARLTQNSTTSHRPPSSDSPYKPRQRPPPLRPGKRVGNRATRASPGAFPSHDGSGAAA